jgi:hypothetical protein
MRPLHYHHVRRGRVYLFVRSQQLSVVVVLLLLFLLLLSPSPLESLLVQAFALLAVLVLLAAGLLVGGRVFDVLVEFVEGGL